MRIILIIAGAIVAVLLFGCNSLANAATRSNVSAWLEHSELVADNGSYVARVNEIFNNLKRANGRLSHPSKLYIINSNGLPWVIALEDKNIILTRGAIEVIYENSDPIEFRDARMAFVLGHELKHVVENDFRHNSIFKFAASPASKLIKVVENNIRKDIELQADKEGLAYATVAGYDTAALFSETGGARNFLDYWVYQTNTSLAHNVQEKNVARRVADLKQEYQSTVSSVEFFKYGVRLAHFGKYKQAQELFEEVYKEYRSFRVLANRGYIHLQLARSAMRSTEAYRYWYPDLLELDAGIKVSRSMDNPLSADSVIQLNIAVDLLSESLSRAKHDITARLNLITAYLYLEQYEVARGVIVQIEDWEKQPQLRGLDAMITVNNKRQQDPWNTESLKELKVLVDSSEASFNIIYNYARLLSDGGRKKESVEYWQRLAQSLSLLPRNYQVMVCREVSSQACVAAKNIADRRSRSGVEAPDLVMKIKPGDHIFSDNSVRSTRLWEDPVRLRSSDKSRVYLHGSGDSTLVVDNRVSLVTFKQHGVNHTADLVSRFDQPHEIIKARTEEIWSYGAGWSALVSNGKVREIWMAQ